ncbi:MAG: hypothetical protein Q8Q07_04600 [Dehalococcoidales bacterium]|nr:hypothetical protein [Dehalococcoidales bacterium]
MMKSESDESGLDELTRLSRKMADEAQQRARSEQQRTAQRQIARDVLQGVKEISISVAMGQLKLVATPEILTAVTQLRNKPGTRELRKIITDLSHDLERRTGSFSPSDPELEPIAQSVRTLAILIELLFSLE